MTLINSTKLKEGRHTPQSFYWKYNIYPLNRKYTLIGKVQNSYNIIIVKFFRYIFRIFLNNHYTPFITNYFSKGNEGVAVYITFLIFWQGYSYNYLSEYQRLLILAKTIFTFPVRRSHFCEDHVKLN